MTQFTTIILLLCTLLFSSQQALAEELPKEITEQPPPLLEETANEPEQPIITSIELDPSDLTVEQGRIGVMQVTAQYSDGSVQTISGKEVTWKVKDTTIASIFQGQLSGIRRGTTIVEASYEGEKTMATVTVVQPAEIVKTGPKYSFFELVSNMGLLNSVLETYDLNEIEVHLPKKVIGEVNIVPTAFATDITLSTTSDVRKVTIRSRGVSYDGIQKASGKFERGIAGLKVGDELTIQAFDQSGKQLQYLVFRIKDSNMLYVEDNGGLEKSIYSLRELTQNNTLFNQVLENYSMLELTVVTPLRYLGTITIDPTQWGTFFTVQTIAAPERIVLIHNGIEYDMLNEGNGLYKREIVTALEGELVTIQVIDENGEVAEEKILTVTTR